MPDNRPPKSCPSSTCTEGSALLGTVKQDGTISFAQTRMRLDKTSVAEFQKLGNPESHFRFSSSCVQSGCHQWTGTQCSIIQKVLTAFSETALPPDAPSCLIRHNCRWFFQEGVQACYACSFVVTDFAGGSNPIAQ